MREWRRWLATFAAASGVIVLALGCGGGPDRGVGQTCTNNDDCRDFCASGADFPGGFCTTNCFDDTDCPGGTVCADINGGVCVFPCDGEPAGYCADLLEDGRYECRDQDTPDGRVVLVCRGD